MGLETGTYISDLDSANPVGATDKRHQGDNHIRLVKSVLKTTFPNATKPFRFPTSATKTGNYTVLSSDDSAVFYCDTSGGAFNMTLPALISGDAGYEVSVVKSTTDTNAVTVVGTINGESNMTLNNRFEVLNLFWTGTVWLGAVVPNGLRVTVITGDLTVTEDHLDGAILSTPSGANKTITLPAVANYRGRTLTIHHTGNTYSTIIDGNASETVNGSATMTLAGTNAFVMLMAMATGWVAIATAVTPATAVEMFTGTDTTKPIVSSVLAALWKQDTSIASAGTLTIPDTGSYFHVTGTTTITDIDFTTDTAGREVKLVFDGALTLTHNATTLILPGGASITTAAGDVAVIRSEGSDVVRCLDYTKASGTAITPSYDWDYLGQYNGSAVASPGFVLAIPAGYDEIIILAGVYGNGTNSFVVRLSEDSGASWGSDRQVTIGMPAATNSCFIAVYVNNLNHTSTNKSVVPVSAGSGNNNAYGTPTTETVKTGIINYVGLRMSFGNTTSGSMMVFGKKG